MSTARPGRPRDPMVDSAVLEATLAVLAVHGPLRLSLREVAARAGVARTTIHRRWPVKGALLLAALAHLLDEQETVPETASARDDLVAVCVARIGLYSSGAGRWFVSTVAWAGSDDLALRPAVAALAEAERAPFVRAISRGVANGEFSRDVDATIAAELLLAPLMTRLLAGDLSAAFAPALVGQVLAGLLPRPARATQSRRGG